MAKVFSCEFQSAKQLYWIADELKTMGQGFRVQFQFTNKNDMEHFRIAKFRGQVQPSEQPESEDQSEQDAPDDRGVSDSSGDQVDDARSTSSKDTSFQKAPRKVNNSYIYQVEKPIMYFFGNVYGKEIKQLSEQFDCQINIANELCTIQGDDLPYKQIIGRLRTMVENILVKQINPATFKGIQNSKLVKDKLAEKSIRICSESGGHYWARKENINAETFEKVINGIETTFRKRMSFWQLPLKSIEGRMIWLFHIIRRKITSKVAVLEKLYEVDIEECERMRGYTIHADTESLANTIVEELGKLLNKLFIFSISIEAKPTQRQDLENYLKRNCSNVEYYWGRKKLCFCLSQKDIPKKLPRIFKYLMNTDIAFQAKTQLYLHASHYRSANVAKNFLATYNIENFRKTDTRFGNIVVSTPYEDDELNKKFLEVVEVYGKYIEGLDSTIILNESTTESSTVASETTEKLEASDIADCSVGINDSVSEFVQPQPNMKKSKQYNFAYPLVACEEFEGEEWFRTGKKDKQLTELLESELDKGFNCKPIIYNRKVVQPKLLEGTLLFSTGEEFLNKKGNFVSEIKLYEIARRTNNPRKYLAQAIASQLVRNEDGSWTAQSGDYLVTHSVIEY